MKRVLTFCCCMLAITGIAQVNQSEVLGRDSANDYVYHRDILVKNISKPLLYERVKKWALANLNPADNFFKTDEAGKDSVMTIAYMQLENIPEVQNQMVSYNIQFRFYEGRVKIDAYAFIYHGMNKTNNDVYDVRLDSLNKLPGNAQDIVQFGFDKKFSVLMNDLEKFIRTNAG